MVQVYANHPHVLPWWWKWKYTGDLKSPAPED